MLSANETQVHSIVEAIFMAARNLKDSNGLKVSARRGADSFENAEKIYLLVMKGIELASGFDQPIQSVRPAKMEVAGLSDDTLAILGVTK